MDKLASGFPPGPLSPQILIIPNDSDPLFSRHPCKDPFPIISHLATHLCPVHQEAYGYPQGTVFLSQSANPPSPQQYHLKITSSQPLLTTPGLEGALDSWLPYPYSDVKASPQL